MKKIVILKGGNIDFLEEDVLSELLEIMFPECNIKIQLDSSAESPDEERHTMPGKTLVA